jgi:acetyl-CoA carboxylase carboxyltransferase component
MGYVDDVIIPGETRPRVIAAFEMLRSKRVSAPSRKHDNMPL